MKIKFTLFILFTLAIALLLAFIEMQFRSASLENRQIDGQVYSIEWKSSNHGMPLIEIKTKTGTTKWINDHTFILTRSTLKKGDYLFKESGSKICSVNSSAIRCIK